MSDLLKLLPIFGLSVLSQLWFNYFNFRFFFSKIKTGGYTIPFFSHVFEQLATFTLAVWSFNALFCYIPATIIAAYVYKFSVENFGGLSSGMIVSTIASVLTSVLFMRLLAGESLNRNGWIGYYSNSSCSSICCLFKHKRYALVLPGLFCFNFFFYLFNKFINLYLTKVS